MDPYDFAAERLPTDVRARIAAFWEHFCRHAEGLDRCFSSHMTDMSTDPTEVMAALGDVSPNLMWEFGPADTGHSLCVTAEWSDESLVLARALHRAAPDLPRWTFYEARQPSPGDFSQTNFEARFGAPLVLTNLDARLNESGKIDVIGHGRGGANTLKTQTFQAAVMILGEELERDWLGFCECQKDGGLLGKFRRPKETSISGPALLDQFRGEIAKARAKMPDQPLSAAGWADRGRVLMQINELPQDHPRHDLMTYNTTSEAFARAALGGEPFSSARLSNFGEWFACLRVERTPEAPFDMVEDRADVEELLHHALEVDAVGGVVGSGHGREAVYFDIGGPDVARLVAAVTRFLSDKPYASAARLTFLDRGVETVVLGDFGATAMN